MGLCSRAAQLTNSRKEVMAVRSRACWCLAVYPVLAEKIPSAAAARKPCSSSRRRRCFLVALLALSLAAPTHGRAAFRLGCGRIIFILVSLLPRVFYFEVVELPYEVHLFLIQKIIALAP